MYRKFFKRLLDFLIALIALPFVLITILIMAPFIYIDDPGPIFYNAPRRGKDGKVFKMFKLRSMYVNAPDIRNEDGSTYNGSDDLRVTKIGKFMRKASIDEFPQFLNVLIGDMSLVGPRPTLTKTPYNELTDLGRARLMVRPGITGYAQAYYRNSVSAERKFQIDCEYIEKMSFVLDVKILFQTVASVAQCKNIYINQDEKQKGNKKNHSPEEHVNTSGKIS